MFNTLSRKQIRISIIKFLDPDPYQIDERIHNTIANKDDPKAKGIGSGESAPERKWRGLDSIEEGFIQKRIQRSSLLYGGPEFIQFLAAL